MNVLRRDELIERLIEADEALFEDGEAVSHRASAEGALRVVEECLGSELRALLESVRNLRGWRVQGQTHYLAHVDAIEERVDALAATFGGQ